MTRSPIPLAVLTETLVSSRRRCAICFGLNRDTSLKSGQVAHLDHNASNNALSNLAFLCLEHHDLYDSTTRQSKNITRSEVITYRDELLTSLNATFSNGAIFGSATIPERRKTETVDGHYIRIIDGDSSYESAEIKISRIASKHSEYHVSGFALWRKQSASVPNIGQFDYLMELNGNAFYHVYTQVKHRSHSINILYNYNKLIVHEQDWIGNYGMNVNFIGEYQRAD